MSFADKLQFNTTTAKNIDKQGKSKRKEAKQTPNSIYQKGKQQT
jgi:hypothetical protein